MIRRFFPLAVAVIALHCAQFPTRYDRLESNKIRNIGFVYSPYAEGAPGDTMRVRAYFAGESVDSVAWSMSYSHVITVYGTDTIMDVFNLPVFGVSKHLPDSIDISFIIPDSTFFLTKAIQSQALGAIQSKLPLSMRSMTQQELAAFLFDFGAIRLDNPGSLIAVVQKWGPSMGITASTSSTAADSILMSVGGLLMPLFSIDAVLFAQARSEQGHTLKIKGNFTIRYNRRIQNTPLSAFFPVNRPPKIRWMALYSVKGDNITDFNPSDPSFSGQFTVSYLYNELFPDSVHDTVLIDKGYTYFMAADSGMVRYTLPSGTKLSIQSIQGTDTLWNTLSHDSIVSDTSLDAYTVKDAKTGRDTTVFETFYYDWQYEDLNLDAVTLPLDSLMLLSGGTQGPVIRMLPSLDTKFTHARIWTTVYDYFLGEYHRPSAFAVVHGDIYFRYSDNYIKAQSK